MAHETSYFEFQCECGTWVEVAADGPPDTWKTTCKNCGRELLIRWSLPPKPKREIRQ